MSNEKEPKSLIMAFSGIVISLILQGLNIVSPNNQCLGIAAIVSALIIVIILIIFKCISKLRKTI